MVDFITEVQDELRKDDYNKWLRRYGPYLIGLVVAILMVASWLEWREASEAREARELSLSYTTASELETAGEVDAARTAFAGLADGAPEGYAGLSLMRAAAIAVDAGDTDEAVRLFDRAAEVFSRDRHAHLARLKAAYLLSADGRNAEAEARLAGLTEKGAPYEFLARELSAHSALAQNELERARTEFSYLATIPGVLPSVQERSAQTLSLMKAGASVDLPDDETTDNAMSGNEDMGTEDLGDEEMGDE